MTQVTVNGNTYSDDGSSSKDMNNGGFREHQLPMIVDTMIDTAGKVAAAAHQVELAEAAAAAAATAASTAVSGPGSTGSSTTSLTISLGVQSLVIQSGKTLSPGMPCTIASTASPRNWMNGSIDSYNPANGALQVNVTNIGVVTPGVYPTLAAWSISLSGPAAVTGVLNELKGGAIVSAATINLDSATGNYLHLTLGTGPVTAVTLAQGAEREVTLDGAVPFTHSANLLLPTDASMRGMVGDVIRFRGEGGGVVRVTSWVRKSGKALVPGFTNIIVATTTQNVNFPEGVAFAEITIQDGGSSGATSTGGVSMGGRGGDSSVTVVPVDPAVTYLATPGSYGSGPLANTNTPSQPGGLSSFSGAGITTVTSANGAIKFKGGDSLVFTVQGGLGQGAGGSSLFSGASSVSMATAGFGAGGRGVSVGEPGVSGKAGVVVIKY
jgi:hypothetical protein